VFLGAMILHGLEPGPTLLQEHTDEIYTLILTLTVACVVATLIVLALARPMAYLTLVDAHVLAPMVTVVALVGAYALNGEFGDVIVALAFAIIGYLMIRFQYPRITFTIALVLGEVTERSFFQAMGVSDGSWKVFVTGAPAISLLVLIVLTLMIPSFRAWLAKRRRRAGGAA
jgi:putative tricarboxylic transport membrane protein